MRARPAVAIIAAIGLVVYVEAAAALAALLVAGAWAVWGWII